MRRSSSVAGALVVGGIRLDQRGVSPVRPAACRYWLSCVEYAREAIGRPGLLRGGVAALGRLLRCQPLVRGGIDLSR